MRLSQFSQILFCSFVNNNTNYFLLQNTEVSEGEMMEVMKVGNDIICGLDMSYACVGC